MTWLLQYLCMRVHDLVSRASLIPAPGQSVPWAGGILKFGGLDLTDHLMKLLTECGHSFTTTAEREIVRDIKEKLCFVALDYEQEVKDFVDTKIYELPDGQNIMVQKSRFQCAEALFKPSFLKLEDEGTHELVARCLNNARALGERNLLPLATGTSHFRCLPHELISKVEKFACPLPRLMKELGGIILSGGSSMFPGIADRLQKELKLILPVNSPLKIVCPPERKYSSWIGGSIIASLACFERMWITKADYDEDGPLIVQWRCFT